MDAARCWLAAVDLWLVALGYLSKEEAINVIIELHAPTSSTQKLKLMGKGGQFTYTPTVIGGQWAEWACNYICGL